MSPDSVLHDTKANVSSLSSQIKPTLFVSVLVPSPLVNIIIKPLPPCSAVFCQFN